MDARPVSPRDTWMAVLLALAAPAVVVLAAVTSVAAMRLAYGVTAVVLAGLLAGVLLGRADRAATRLVLLVVVGAGCYLTGLATLGSRDLDEVREIADLAFLDELTGLPDRRQGTVHLRAALVRTLEGGGPEAVVLFDLDHFKQVNDTHGHDAGDDVLRVVAAIARAALRPGDVLCRWGGEEFLVLLSGVDAGYAAVCAERCRAAIAAWEGPHRLTASYGVTEIHPDDTVTDALRRADLALYEAKAMGRDQVRVHHRRTTTARPG